MVYKLIVISDIHHDMARLKAMLPMFNAADYVIFCGDGINDIMSMRRSILAPLVCVRGNNDVGANFADMVSVLLGDTRAIVTHGHRQLINNDITGLVTAAKLKGCQMVFYGHTHQFYNRMVDGVHLICPGALCDGSYAVVVGDGITFKCKQEFI
ncbi:MAG: YfcE family phosphodiesterase [Clostridiales bacterium]|nr:YfcE family phosphodiesterase [Clostridiales bacterium]